VEHYALEAAVVTEVDLIPLPEPVRRYLIGTGVVGRARVQNYRVRFQGRIRSGPGSRWMPFEADQQSFADQPTRLIAAIGSVGAIVGGAYVVFWTGVEELIQITVVIELARTVRWDFRRDLRPGSVGRPDRPPSDCGTSPPHS